MATARESASGALRLAEAAGQSTLRGIEMIGYGATLFGQAVYWLFLGRRHGQVVRRDRQAIIDPVGRDRHLGGSQVGPVGERRPTRGERHEQAAPKGVEQ